MSILGFAFDNKCADILALCNVSPKIIVKSSEDSIKHLIGELVQMNPSCILGLGLYTGKDQGALRIETKCTNKFRNTIRGKKVIELPIESFLRPDKKSRYSDGIGNSFCNLVSFEIMSRMQKQILNADYCFIHIPKSFSVERGADIINGMIAAPHPNPLPQGAREY